MKQRMMPYIELDRQDLAAIQAGQPFIVTNAGNESVILRFVGESSNGKGPTLALEDKKPPRIPAIGHRRRFSDRDWKKFKAYYETHGWAATAEKFDLSSSSMQKITRR